LELSYSNGDGRLLLLEFDATVRELHTSQLTVTEHPVEKGANVSDHVRKELARLTVEVLVTNHPLTAAITSGMGGVTGSVRNLDLPLRALEETRQQRSLTFPKKTELPISVPLAGAAIQATGLLDGSETVTVHTRTTTEAPDGATAQVLRFDGPFDRVRSLFEELKGLQDSAILVTAHTTVAEYENMMLANLTAPREVKDGGSIRFTFDLKEVRFVTSKTVKAPIDKKKPTTKQNLGAKPTTPVERDGETLGHALLGGAQKKFNVNLGIRP